MIATNGRVWRESLGFPALFAFAVLGIRQEQATAGTILLQDNFDSYADTASFTAAWPVVGTQPSGAISGTVAVSAPNAVRYVNTADNPSAPRNGRLFDETGTPSIDNVIRFSVDFYDSDGAAFPYREFATLLDNTGGGSGQLVSLGLNNNRAPADDGGNFYMARLVGFTPDYPGAGSGSFFKLNDNPLLLRSTGWHNLAVEITDTEFKFFVDGSLAKAIANSLTLRSYEAVRLGSGSLLCARSPSTMSSSS